MTTTVLTNPATPTTTAAPAAAPTRIPLRRLVAVELRKSFDTRSGFWLLIGTGLAAVAATLLVIAFAPADQLSYGMFTLAIGKPMSILLPLIALLSVTAEWTQRSGLTTFTLVPHRGRVLGAKFLAAIAVGVASMCVALVVGVLGTVVGSAIAGVDPVWNVSAAHFALIVLGSVLGMLFGFTLGLLIRNSAGAIVTYFVYTLVLPPLLGLLAANQKWFADLQPWVDYNYSQTSLFDGSLTSQQWQHLAVSGGLWFLLPMAIGLLVVRRAEVK